MTEGYTYMTYLLLNMNIRKMGDIIQLCLVNLDS